MIWPKEKKLNLQLEAEREQLLKLRLELSEPNSDQDPALKEKKQQCEKNICSIKGALRQAGKKVADRPDDPEDSWLPLPETKPQLSAPALPQQLTITTSDPAQKQLPKPVSEIVGIVANIAAIIQLLLQLLLTPLSYTAWMLFGVSAWGIALVISIMTLRRAHIGRLAWLAIGTTLLGAITLGAALFPVLLNQLSQLIRP